MERPEVIDGDGVRLRRWRPEDVRAVEAVLGDPLVTRWSALAEEGAAAFVERQRTRADGLSFAIEAEGRCAGKVALGHLDPRARRAELSYWLVPDARGRGVATAAARALTTWALDAGGFDLVVAEAEPGNAASLAVLRRLGFERVPGPLRSEVDRGGVRRTLIRHELRAPPGRAR